MNTSVTSATVIVQKSGIRKAGIGSICATILLSACAAPAPGPMEHDPYEGFNRGVHGFNKGLDTVLVRPASDVYGVIPAPVRQGVSNFAGNLDLPGDLLNNLLQGRIENFGHNFFRMAINTTVGIGGIFDPASAIGLEHRKTDFGETMHVYGMAEGNYLELPGFGPSTTRDAFGLVLDFTMNPVSRLATGDKSTIGTGAKILSKLGDRYRYSGTVDSILYDSADSYAQARLLYLQNRRFELGQTGGADGAADAGFIDPYED